MAIWFGREICGQLEDAASREWLVTNGIGGYACGTVAGHLTRAYHGLLVAAVEPPVGRSLLVTKLDETLTYRGQEYPLFTNQWGEETIDPHGYRQIEHFALSGQVPVWTYAVGEVQLQKRVWMVRSENTTAVRYSLTRGPAVDLAIKVMVNCRDHHGGSTPGDWPVLPVPQGVQVQPPGQPFYLLTSQGDWHIEPQWLQNYGLDVEHYRGTGDRDTHLQAAVLTVHLEPQDSVTLIATTEAAYQHQAWDGAALLTQRQEQDGALVAQFQQASSQDEGQGNRAIPTPGWITSLVQAADSFIVNRAAGEAMGKTIIAGYPWFGDWGRDTMISLPGLTIATGRPELARPILETFGHHLSQGMLPNLFPDRGEPEYNTVDAVLWYFEAVRAYYDTTQDNSLIEDLFPALVEVVDWHQRGTRYGIHVAEDGLLWAGEPGAQLTWMDAKVDDWVVTPRIGKPVEINALWYNALRVMVYLGQKLGQPTQRYEQLAQRCRQGFARFWSAADGYCFDVIDGPEGNDNALRPNQIFAVALPYGNLPGEPLLTSEQQAAVVEAVAANLVTSYGLRSLAPSHPDYVGTYGGDRYQRDGSYHQGTVWGWLMGPFVQAHFKLYRDPAAALSFLLPFADHLNAAGLGSISEIFDGDAPHTPRGCFAQAWSVAEVLRVWQVICGSFQPSRE